jgi:hypothetical protein
LKAFEEAFVDVGVVISFSLNNDNDDDDDDDCCVIICCDAKKLGDVVHIGKCRPDRGRKY